MGQHFYRRRFISAKRFISVVYREIFELHHSYDIDYAFKKLRFLSRTISAFSVAILRMPAFGAEGLSKLPMMSSRFSLVDDHYSSYSLIDFFFRST